VELVGRDDECRELDRVLGAVLAGHSRALVICGEAGIGKTALLDQLARRASGCQVIRVAGVETEMEFAFAALHQLCGALTAHLERIPEPQRDALAAVFGERPDPVPDPFLVGLAVLSLLSEAAHQRALLVLVDDHQWLDRASARLLAFVARRLVAESVAILFATRTVSDELRGLPDLAVGGLGDHDSRRLLATALHGPLDVRVSDQIIAEARGNPLALLELPRTLTPAELAGGFGSPAAPVSHSLEGTFRGQLDSLPAPTRRLLALAAADPAGDPVLLWRAAGLLGLAAEHAVPAMEAGLAEIGSRVLFRHPLIRSSAYRYATLSERQTIHAALATVTDAAADPERRAWHLGHAAVGPDESVADELARCAERVGARGGMSASAAFLERATQLTVDPSCRCDRAIAAAAMKAQAGVFDAARALLKIAEAAPLTELQRARSDLVRAQLAMMSSHGKDAAPLLLGAARRLEAIDPKLARETYLDAMSAALFAGRLATDGGMLEVCEAAGTAARSPGARGPADLLLEGLAAQHIAGFEAGLPAIQEALASYGQGMTAEQEMRWMLLACFAASRVWDIERHTWLGERYVQLVRDAGAASQFPLALSSCFLPLLFKGELDEAACVTVEMGAAIDAMGKNLSPYSAIALSAWQGRRTELAALSESALRDLERRGEGHGLTVIAWAEAVMANAGCDYRAARDAAAYASGYRGEGGASWWALVELVEAASRLGDADAATAALDQLTAMTSPSGTDWALGVEARSRALVTQDESAEPLYQEAIERCARAGLRPDLGRARLVYGEWLRRQRRRIDARAQLQTAHELFESMGMEAFGERTRRELLATGEKARRRTVPAAPGVLTPQEAQIARLARDGLSNPEIGARLFISARTVQYHLGKVFTKLGIRSRSQLGTALPEPD
jgi:DNA-binding CsgD family transcriptional regulator